MIDLYVYFLTLVMVSMVANTALSIYGIFFRPSMIKKIIALTILGDTANTFAIIIGYKRWVNPETPVTTPVLLNYTNINKTYIEEFARMRAVDPLPQALVLTAIVIGLAVNLYLVFLTLQTYRLYGTTDVREIRRLRG
ncbi:MAG: sodium:proton antiporter [Desulfurococcaceae archaeon]